MKLLVRWTDKEGNNQSKEYDDYKTATKARDWLLDNGANDADIAVIMPKREPIETEDV